MEQHPFNSEHFDPTNQDPSKRQLADMSEGLQQHIYGQRVKAVRHVIEPDLWESQKQGKPVVAFETHVEMENGVLYVTRVVLYAGSMLSAGDGLARYHE